jgi:GNAT superfamily N-acetyltransferase
MLSNECAAKHTDGLPLVGDFGVRSYQSRDREEVLRLYLDGLLAGSVDPTDAASDVRNVLVWYFQRDQDHFWVAEAHERIIGTIGAFEDQARVAHLRRLRVDRTCQSKNGVALALIGTAICHARLYGCLKLVLHTSLDESDVMKLVEPLGLQLSRIREGCGRHLIEFYDNLYARDNTLDVSGVGSKIDEIRAKT